VPVSGFPGVARDRPAASPTLSILPGDEPAAYPELIIRSISASLRKDGGF
jgi:hypothetical protein